MLYNGESRNSNYDDLLWVHGPRVGNWSWQRAWGAWVAKIGQSRHWYIYIYIFKHVSLNNKGQFCLYNLFKILSSFLIKYIYIYIYIYMCVCVCVCVYIYIYIYTYTGCLNIHGTHVTANNSTNNNAVLFLFQIWKQYTIMTINPWSPCLGQERKKYFVSLFIWRQNHTKVSQNRFNPLIWKWFITETRNSKKDCLSWKLI